MNDLIEAYKHTDGNSNTHTHTNTLQEVLTLFGIDSLTNTGSNAACGSTQVSTAQ